MANVQVYLIDKRDFAFEHEYAVSLLSADELERYGNYRNEQRKSSYLIARSVLRLLLAQSLATFPDLIQFSYNEFGKPFLPNQELFFNLSYSGDFIVLAVTKSCALGIDIEGIDAGKISREMEVVAFSECERKSLARLEGIDYERAFFAIWCRKEAFVKATGLGLTMNLQSFSIDISKRNQLFFADGLSLLALDLVEGYESAICCKTAGVINVELKPLKSIEYLYKCHR